MQYCSQQTYSFEDFTLDLGRACLLHKGQAIKLRPKSFETLKHLVQNPGRLVTKDELIQAVGPDSFVTDDSLVQCLMDIRRALGGDSQHYIKTVPRRGYIFEAEVIEQGLGTTSVIRTEQVEGVSVVIEAEKQEEDRGKEELKERVNHVTRARPAPRWGVGIAVAVGLTLVAGAGIYLLLSLRSGAPSQAWVIKKLTTFVPG
jgi:DNA-binding winged helix-turn-helix (wHTH) protein